MEKLLEEALLFDFYGELLTAHQKNIYEDFVLNDLSLSEIAEEKDISRQGVYDIVKRCRKQLQGYEQKLHLVEKFINTKVKVSKINEWANEILAHQDDKDQVMKAVVEIEHLSDTIIDEL